MPAVGFAAGDVTLADLLEKNNLLPDLKQVVDAYLAFEATERSVALRCAEELRQAGFSVKYTLGDTKSLSKQLKKAYGDNPRFVLIFTHEEVLQNKVQVKHATENESQLVAIADIANYLRR